MVDSENYFHEDEELYSKMLVAYSDLYSQARNDKDYILCEKLRIEFSSYSVGYRPKITLEDNLGL